MHRHERKCSLQIWSAFLISHLFVVPPKVNLPKTESSRSLARVTDPPRVHCPEVAQHNQRPKEFAIVATLANPKWSTQTSLLLSLRLLQIRRCIVPLTSANPIWRPLTGETDMASHNGRQFNQRPQWWVFSNIRVHDVRRIFPLVAFWSHCLGAVETS